MDQWDKLYKNNSYCHTILLDKSAVPLYNKDIEIQ